MFNLNVLFGWCYSLASFLSSRCVVIQVFIKLHLGIGLAWVFLIVIPAVIKTGICCLRGKFSSTFLFLVVGFGSDLSGVYFCLPTVSA